MPASRRKVTRIGLPDRYIECGAVPTLQARYGLTTEAIVATIAALAGGSRHEDHRDRDLHRRRRLEELAVRARSTPTTGIHGIGEGTLNGFIRTTEAGVHELKHLGDRAGPAPHQRARQAHARQRVARWRPYPPHGDRGDRGRLLGHPRQDRSACRSTSCSAARCATACSATPMAGTAPSARRRPSSRRPRPCSPRASRRSSSIRSAPRRASSRERNSTSPTTSAACCATSCRRTRRILIDVHARFTEIAALQAAERFADSTSTGGRSRRRATGRRRCTRWRTARPIPVATGEMYDTVGQFYHAGRRRRRQHLPARADVARRHRHHRCRSPTWRWRMAATSRPHQSGGPVATAVCLQLAAAVPNFLIQEHFDAFNEPWTRDLVTWHPTIDPTNGHLSLPDAPGLGIDLNIEAIEAHPYDPHAYLNVHAEGWEKRLGTDAREQGQDRSARRSRGRRSRSRGW